MTTQPMGTNPTAAMIRGLAEQYLGRESGALVDALLGTPGAQGGVQGGVAAGTGNPMLDQLFGLGNPGASTSRSPQTQARPQAGNNSTAALFNSLFGTGAIPGNPYARTGVPRGFFDTVDPDLVARVKAQDEAKRQRELAQKNYVAFTPDEDGKIDYKKPTNMALTKFYWAENGEPEVRLLDPNDPSKVKRQLTMAQFAQEFKNTPTLIRPELVGKDDNGRTKIIFDPSRMTVDRGRGIVVVQDGKDKRQAREYKLSEVEGIITGIPAA